MKGCDRVLVAFLAPPRNLAVHSIVPQFGSFLDPYSILLSLKISNLQIDLDNLKWIMVQLFEILLDTMHEHHFDKVEFCH